MNSSPRIIFYSPVHFEKWDWRNSVDRGIGGSETSQVEMVWRLARRGHQVVSYAPLPKDCPGEWRGSIWRDYKKADFGESGLWVLYRCPDVLDRFGSRTPDQPRWLMCQDTHYPTMTRERAQKLDRVLALCPVHARHLAQTYPYVADKIWVTSNGVKADLVREVLKDPPARNLKRLIYASSPDRGLETLLKIFSRVREHVGDAELHIFYGFDNIDKYLKLKQKWAIERFKGLKKAVMAASKQPGVTWHGRVSQIQLYREIASSALWVYPTDFTETSCITCMEMQSLGAIPITSDLWALADNVRHGVRLHGNPVADPLVRARYVGEIVKLLSVPDLQNHFRRPMMDWALTNFNWERWVDQWEHAIEGQTHRIWPTQFYYQHRQVQGRILNVGCGSDLTNFAGRGATNLDVREVGPDGTPNQAHVIHDVRDPWPQQLGTFDSVIIGDLLEHVTDEDAQTILEHAVKALRPDGRLVLTIPLDDYRPAEHQHLVGQGKLEDYAPGVSCYHRVLRTSEQVRAWFKTPWKIVDEREIDYGHFSGLGLTAVRV